jgi:hypothetical protein
MDRKHWGDPEVFRPDRFLNEQGGILQDDWFVPFGFGKIRNRPAHAWDTRPGLVQATEFLNMKL